MWAYGDDRVFFPSCLLSMFLKALLGLLVGVWLLLGLLTAAVTTRYGVRQGTLPPPPPPLLLVSFDGFRADYLKKFPMINLKRFYSQGVLVEELNNIFVTKTFPNHYTLVTHTTFLLSDQSTKGCVVSALLDSGNLKKAIIMNQHLTAAVFVVLLQFLRQVPVRCRRAPQK